MIFYSKAPKSSLISRKYQSKSMLGPFFKIQGNLMVLSIPAIKYSRVGFLTEHGDP